MLRRASEGGAVTGAQYRERDSMRCAEAFWTVCRDWSCSWRSCEKISAGVKPDSDLPDVAEEQSAGWKVEDLISAHEAAQFSQL